MDDQFSKTAKFYSMFDQFFDCLNTRNAEEEKQNRKPDLDPYTRWWLVITKFAITLFMWPFI